MPSNEHQWMTLGFLLLMTIVTVAFDFWVIHYYGVNTSISRVLRHNPTLWIGLVFWLGVLVGHIWLPTE